MSSEWPMVKLCEVLEITSSKRIKRADYVEIGIPFYRSKEVIEKSRGNEISTELFITEEQFYSIKNKFGAPLKNDILLTSVGTLGVAYQVKKEEDFYFKDGNLTWFRNYKNCVNPEFVFYWLCSPEAQRKLDEVSIGSTQKALTIASLKSVEMPLPPLNVQLVIVEILRSINLKLDSNRKINQTLEQMAQAIFKSWFVDFEPVKAKIAALDAGGSEDDALLAAMQAIAGSALFATDAADADAQTQLARLQAEHPEQYATLRATAELFPSAMQDSELGEIPEGWECMPLDEVAHYQNGLALQKYRPENEDDFLPVLKIAQLRAGYPDGNEKASPNIRKDCIVNSGDIIFSWSGSLIVDVWCGGKAALNQHLFKVTSEEYPKWLYYYFTCHHLEEFQRIAAAKAVTMGHIKREHLNQALCAIPADELIKQASRILGNILDKEIALKLQIKSLSELRDTLLPKLLSGELSLSAAEEQLADSVKPADA